MMQTACGTVVAIKVKGQRKEFVLEELEYYKIKNVQMSLEYERDDVREKILDVLSIDESLVVWDDLREINGYLDMITNYLALKGQSHE